MKFLALSILLLISIFSHAESREWSEFSLSEQADFLYDLDYTGEDWLPVGTSVIDLLEGKEGFSINDIDETPYKEIVKSVYSFFDDEISRESIEQSPYPKYGDERISSFYLLRNQKGEVLGGVISAYQEGRDLEGEDSDVNWSATMRFGPNGGVFRDERGEPFDELRFEWSGH